MAKLLLLGLYIDTNKSNKLVNASLKSTIKLQYILLSLSRFECVGVNINDRFVSHSLGPLMFGDFMLQYSNMLCMML